MLNTDKSEFWEELYKNDSAGWNMKSATPAFLDLLNNNLLKDKKTLLVIRFRSRI